MKKGSKKYNIDIPLLNEMNPGEVTMGYEKTDPFVLGHEVGHGLNEKSKNPLRRIPNSDLTKAVIGGTALTAGYKSGKSEDKDEKRKNNIIGGSSIVAGNLVAPIEEMSASQRSIKFLKEAGVSKKYLKSAKKYAHENNMAYFNPKIIKENKIIRNKTMKPLAINGSLFVTGKVAGEIKKRNKKKKEKKEK